jgi:chloramphenicol 3-O phosphotransferase
MPRRLVVITGSSGVGKSALAKSLQEELLPVQWLHFSVDSIFYCLPRSVVLRVDQRNDRSLVDSRAIVAGAHACTRTLLSLGHKVIFDTVIASEAGAIAMRSAFDEFDPLIVELTCSWEEIARRTRARGDRTIEEAVQGYRNARGPVDAHHTFDSTDRSPRQIAAEVKGLMRGACGAT